MAFSIARILLVVAVVGQTYGHLGSDDEEGIMPGHSTTTLLHISASTNYSMNSANELKQRVSASRYRSLTGRSQADIAAKFNSYAAGHASVSQLISCSDLTSSEVASLAQKLKLLIDDKIRVSLPEVDGRQLHIDPEIASLFDTPALRDLQCVETMKLWAHHIPVSVKDDPSTSVILPTVPSINVEQLVKENEHLNKTVSCVAGHTVVDSDLNFDLVDIKPEEVGKTFWPHWPRNFHFRATGYGPYPFWTFGPHYGDIDPEATSVNMTVAELYGGSDMEMWHSTSKRATKFYHSSCRWENVWQAQLGTTPCIAIQLGIYGTELHPTEPHGHFYLFQADASNRSSNGHFCCDATFTQLSGQSLGTINHNFMDNMKYVGNADFHGHYHDGVSKQYVMAMEEPKFEAAEGDPILPLEVWYETDLEGKPLRFAEIGSDQRQLQDNILLYTDLPLIYEEFDPTSFSYEENSEDEFKLPEECLVENLATCK